MSEEATKQGSAPEKQGDTWQDNLRIFIIAALIAIVIRSFFFQPFNIPSSSMELEGILNG